MPALNCPHCTLALTKDEAAGKACPSCGTVFGELIAAGDPPLTPHQFPDQASEPDDQRLIYAHRQMERGFDADEVKKQLMAKGLDAHSAELFVRIVAKVRMAAVRERGLRNMFIGGGVAIIGLIVTIGSYYLAAANGWSTFTIATGAILIGSLQFLYGALQTIFQSN
jgi:hypothetical protein